MLINLRALICVFAVVSGFAAAPAFAEEVETVSPLYDSTGKRLPNAASKEGKLAAGESKDPNDPDDHVSDATDDTSADPDAARRNAKERSDLPGFHAKENEFSLLIDPEKPRSYFWMPLVSLFLPGISQWTEEKYGWAGFYTGGALLSMAYALTNVPEKKGDNESDEHYYNRMTHGVTERKYMYGMQLVQTLGGFSTYHTFRQSVRANQRHGKFLFLTEEETMKDIMLAPFQFKYLTSKNTYIPLAIGAALNLFLVSYVPVVDDETERDGLSTADAFFASALSYNAGTHEEAVFRGWLMPVLQEKMQSTTWSNLTTAGIFAVAHLNSVSVPLPQFVLGWHLGSVTQQNNWKISESIFIHTWWDVMAFLAIYQLKQKEKTTATVYNPWFGELEPRLHLPPITFYF